ncbi:DNA end-binding protein Ku [Streptomyces sp. V3I8]|uniref:non-homologous end joining protein Ku n=1 Tax=Streptomyces sp. V3I8 TaxID=3042279 RepID=UPI0027813571|nr:Ku protein [Streptomyces sp. V3I8]MDQ1036154.1 DNA end-binding protein Ku [Streptomyces sp. V3I8]
MRSIWNGAVSFGLISIPIKLVNATENHSVAFRQIHIEDGSRIRHRKVCEVEDREVTTAEIGRAYEDADGTMIPITDEDLASLPIPTARTIEIVAFVPAYRIDPLQMDAAYYLAANGVPAAKPYTLLREALRRSHKVAVAKFALRGRERLGMLRVVDDVIVMHGLLWPDEIRAPDGVAPEAGVTVRSKELDLADVLMETLGEVDLADLHDDYREAVEELVAAKASGGEAPSAPVADRTGRKVIDLMSALENSVRQARVARGEAGSADVGADADADVKPLRRTAARKRSEAASEPPPSRKKPARKTAAKTTAAGGAAKKTATKTVAKKAASEAKKSAPRRRASA